MRWSLKRGGQVSARSQEAGSGSGDQYLLGLFYLFVFCFCSDKGVLVTFQRSFRLPWKCLC